MRSNSVLTHGQDRIPLGRGTMARLRDLGLIVYVRGSAAMAEITTAGRRRAAEFSREEPDAQATAAG